MHPDHSAGGFRIVGHGYALGARRVDNQALARELETEEHWILQRSGIRARRVADAGETTGCLAVVAARQSIESASGERPGTVVLSTFTPDRILCPTAPWVAHSLGLTDAGAFDINAACSGGVLGLIVAVSLLAHASRPVLFVAADTTTRHLAPTDAKTRILFGDGAAALVLEADRERGSRFLATRLGADGSGANHFGGSATSAAEPIRMDGPALYRFAAERVPVLLHELCDAAAVDAQAIDRIIVHQASGRLIAAIAERFPAPRDRWYMNIEEIGNTGSPAALIALVDSITVSPPRPGEKIALVGFGAGLTWAAALLEWGT